MSVKAVIFGSIGTLSDTSDLQLQAFNMAFEEAGLDWVWGGDEYREMLKKPGGKARIARYAEAKGEDVSASELHRAKIRFFDQLVEQKGITLRPGVADVISAAEARGLKLGFATTTNTDTLELLFSGLFPVLPRSEFDWIGDQSMVEAGKPAPDIFERALRELGVSADEALAIEDTPESAEAAIAAGLRTLGFANAMAKGREFPQGVEMVDHLDPTVLDEVSLAAE
ncbi:MAG: HAD-IA family hydrolase [Pseudomonadota bacterium]